ncbi:MAG: DeoR/GlpR family DNA-binding transcription regulator [Victivallaceae bacterium]|nr:DeoR/GlpR family DNA-binding transcription regulator [Victivallaceae bacterium]
MHFRHKKILDLLQGGGKLSIAEAAERLGVSSMTVRRDFRELEEHKLLLTVKGGAVPHPYSYEPDKSPLMLTPDKFGLAEAMYDAIMPCDAIMISAGFTALAFARVMARRCRRDTVVITNNLSAASALFRSSCKVILLGGELRANSLDLVGSLAEKNIANFHVNWLVSGCDGALAEYGFYTADLNLSQLERQSIGIADHVAIITGSDKFGRKALTRFAAPSEVNLLVTDNRLKVEDERQLSAMRIIKVGNQTPQS